MADESDNFAPTTTPVGVHPSVVKAMREMVAPVAKKAAKAYGVAHKCRDRQIEKFGEDGKGGEFRRMQDDIKANRKLVIRVIFAALGTTTVATVIAQLLISLKGGG